MLKPLEYKNYGGVAFLKLTAFLSTGNTLVAKAEVLVFLSFLGEWLVIYSYSLKSRSIDIFDKLRKSDK